LLLLKILFAIGMILAKVRVSIIICVRVTIISAALSGGGLEFFVFGGISIVNNQLILLG
jgi:ABC-type proline/glycine betaine transport system permease subunit